MPPIPGYDDGLNLASLDFLGDADKLRAEAGRLLSETPDATRAPDRQEGADASDSIWVSVDARGRVAGVEISRHWRDRLGVGEFAGALFEAYVAAVQKSLSAAALAALAAEQEQEQERAARAEADRWSSPYGSAGRSADTPPERAEPEPPVDEREWLNATWDVLDELDGQLRRLAGTDPDAAGRGDRESSVHSPQGHLTLRLRGRGIVGITADHRLVQTAGTEQLRLEALAAFRAAGADRDN